MTTFQPGDRVEIPAVTGTVEHVNAEGEVWVRLDNTRESWVCPPGKIRKIGDPCTAVLHHGPGHQSKARCERKDPHGLEDEHYARDPMEPGFEWAGAEGFE